MAETKDFFISYTGADEHWAKWIAWTIEQAEAGYTCVLQARDFVPGQNFMQKMHLALKNSKQVIAVLSPKYLKSDYAGAEYIAAIVNDPLGSKRALLPVRIKECQPDGMLSGRIYIDLVGKDKERAKRDLLSGIAAARLGAWSDADSGQPGFTEPPGFPGEDEPAAEVVQTPVVKKTEAVNILFIGSDGGAGLDLRGQAEQIEAILSEPDAAGRFNFDAYFDVTIDDIFKILNKHNPHIVHFSGKQNGGNVIIRTPSGGVTTIPDTALAGLLQNLGNNVVMAIIDTCKSSRAARTIAKSLPFAMGVEDDIYDTDAISFYNTFYGALAAGKSIASACGQAKAALEFRRVPKEQIPQLFHQKESDPKSYYFLPE